MCIPICYPLTPQSFQKDLAETKIRVGLIFALLFMYPGRPFEGSKGIPECNLEF